MAAIAAILFAASYFVHQIRPNQVRVSPVCQQTIEDKETSEMDKKKNTEDKYDSDEFDLISLSSENEELTTVRVERKEFSYISSFNTEGRSSGCEPIPINSGTEGIYC